MFDSTRLRTTAVCIAILICAALLAPTAAFAASPDLHVQGTKMIDGAGQPILLHGVNTGAWLFYDPFWYDGGLGLEGTWDQGDDPAHTITPQIRALIGPHPQYSLMAIKEAFWSNYITPADIHALKQDGFNSVRIPIDYRLFSTYFVNARNHHVAVPDRAAPGYAYLDRIIRACHAEKMYAIIDMHISPYGFSDDQQSLDSLKRLWQVIAARYKDETAVGGYDLANEPGWNGCKYSLHEPGAPQDTNTGTVYVEQQLTDAIRQVDPRHMIVVEGFMFDDLIDNLFYDPKTGQKTEALQVKDPMHNLAISCHRYGGNLPDPYDPSKDPGPNGSHYWWDADPMFKLQHVKLLASMADAPLWIGEFGNNQNMWYRSLTDILGRTSDPTDHDIAAGWCLWTYKKGGFDVVSDCPRTPGMQTLAAYYGKMNDYWKKNSGPPPTPDFTPEQADAWLYDAALKTNVRYCATNRDEVDALMRPDWRTRAIPYVSGATLPGRIFACNYDMGAQDVAYHDSDNYNDTWNYRCDGVDLGPCTDSGPSPGYKVVDFQQGEWMRYTVHAEPGMYALNVRYAQGKNEDGVLQVKVNGTEVSTVHLPSTKSWTTYQTVTVPNVAVAAQGKAVIEIDCVDGCDLHWISFDRR